LNYGPNLRDLYRGLARYVSRILRGAKPEDLPVESPRTVELVVNLQTARALGVKIPETVSLSVVVEDSRNFGLVIPARKT